MRVFELLPAIDLRGGRVVRLAQGDFARVTLYPGAPADVAERFADQGARWLHVVDLDGASEGGTRQVAHVREIIERVGDRSSVEVAGGIRTPSAVARCLELGAARAVIGTAALHDPAFAREMVRQHGRNRIVVALDVRGGNAVGGAWKNDDGARPVVAALLGLARAGVSTFEVTAVDRDGLLGGADLELLERLVRLGAGSIVASGGIASLDDLEAVRSTGCAGAIVGRAIYEGLIDLAEAIRSQADGGNREA